jgi:hypothetical protein
MNKKNILLIALGVLAIGLSVAVYLWNKPHRNVQNEKSSAQMSVESLKAEIAGNPAAIDTYLDRVLELKGVVTEAADDHIVLEEFAYIELLESGNQGLEPGQTVAVKARVVSFDDLFGQLRLDQGAVLK